MNALTNLKSKTKSIGNKLGQWKDKAFLATCGAIGAIGAVTPARAEGTDVDALFAALNVAGLSANIKTIMLTGVGLTLLFMGYMKLKKTGRIF
jgi:hypothetical protein